MDIKKIFEVLVPRQKEFYVLFERASENLIQTAELLKKLMSASDFYEQENIIVKIKEYETIGDGITHEVFDSLNKTFITPFDRDDIQDLASSVDDIVDYIDSASQKIRLYKPKSSMEEFKMLAEIILEAAKEIHEIMKGLKNMKHANLCIDACIKINELENKADLIYHNALSKLFEKETDAIELMKKKEILEALERATDRAEDTADVIKTILIKNA